MMKFGEFDQMNVTSSPENVLAPIGTGDDKVHQNQHQIVMPSGRVLSPKTSMPNKDLPLDCSQHDQNQINCCELREYTKRYSLFTSDPPDTEKYRNRRRHTDTLGPLLWIFNVAPAAGHKHRRYHQSQQQQAEVDELGELWKHPLSSPIKNTLRIAENNSHNDRLVLIGLSRTDRTCSIFRKLVIGIAVQPTLSGFC